MKKLLILALLLFSLTSYAQTITTQQLFCLGRPIDAVKRSVPDGYKYVKTSEGFLLYKNAKGNVIGYEFDDKNNCKSVATQMPITKMKPVEAKLATEYRLYEDMYYTNPGHPHMYYTGTVGKTLAMLVATKNLINF